MNRCPKCGRVTDEPVAGCPVDGSASEPFEPVMPSGEVIAGKYRVVRAIGAGPSGEVYEGVADPGGDRVVIRLLSAEVAKDRRLSDQVRRHLMRQKGFSHPGIVRVREVHNRDDRLVLVRDWVDGARLADILAAQGRIDAKRALALTHQMAEALGEVHRVGILHLQLRASNVFVSSTREGGTTERAHLLDFGVGPRVKIGGKPIYGALHALSPEQIEGKVVSFRSDIFSLGVLLYRMVAGRPPFEGDGAEVVERILSTPELPLDDPDSSPIVGRIRFLVNQMLNKKPIHRPISMAQVCERIRDIGREEGGEDIERLTVGPPLAERKGTPPPPPPVARVLARVALQKKEAEAEAGAAPQPAPPPPPAARAAAAAVAAHKVEAPGLPGAATPEAPWSIDVDVDVGEPERAGEPEVPAAAGPDAGEATAEVVAGGPPREAEEAAEEAAAVTAAAETAREATPEEAREAPPGAGAGEAAPAAEEAAPTAHPQAPPPSSGTMQVEPDIVEETALPPPLDRPAPSPPDPVATAYRRGLTHGIATGLALTVISVLAAVMVMRGWRSEPTAEGPAGRASDTVIPAQRPATIVAEAPNEPPGIEEPYEEDAGERPGATKGDAESAADAGAAEKDAAPPGEAAAEQEAGVAADVAAQRLDVAAQPDGPPTADAAAAVRDAAVPPADVAPQPGRADARPPPPAADAAPPPREAATPTPAAGNAERAGELVAEGNRKLSSRDFSGARSAFQQALRLDPGNRHANIGMGRVAFQEGDFEQAIRYLEPAYRRQGNMELGMAYVRTRRLEDAKKQFEILVEHNPDDQSAQRALEAVRRQLGQ